MQILPVRWADVEPGARTIRPPGPTDTPDTIVGVFVPDLPDVLAALTAAGFTIDAIRTVDTAAAPTRGTPT